MQNSNPSPNPSSVPFPYCLSESLARAYLRARETTAGAAPTAADIFAVFARGPEPESSGDSAPDDDDPDAVAGQVDIAELLGVMREPIAWVFTLAERRADGDPVDLAAIQRVRDAALHRVDAIIAGAAPADPPRIRPADVLTVAGLLVGALDPAIVQRAAQIAGAGITDALGALLPLAPLIASELVRTPGSAPSAGVAPHAPGPVSPAWLYDYLPRAAVPFASAYAGPIGTPFTTPHLPRAVVPPWYWPHSLFAF